MFNLPTSPPKAFILPDAHRKAAVWRLDQTHSYDGTLATFSLAKADSVVKSIIAQLCLFGMVQGRKVAESKRHSGYYNDRFPNQLSNSIAPDLMCEEQIQIIVLGRRLIQGVRRCPKCFEWHHRLGLC